MNKHKTPVRVWDGVIQAFEPDGPSACQGGDVPFEQGRAGDALAQQFQKEVCASCPVLVACARHALEHEPYGLWGLTESQRGNLGGVVAEEWAERTMDPMTAITELEANGIHLDTIEEMVTPTRANQVVFAAIKVRRGLAPSGNVTSLRVAA